MTIYLGLGANDGDRKGNLECAIDKLIAAGFRLQKVSPMVESPALLPSGAQPEWHKPYLNLVICGNADWQPAQGLAIAKQIEKELGRSKGARWSPRPIDIDLLLWQDADVADVDLTLPHADACRRDFVLTPLLHLQPDLAVGANGERVFDLTQTIRPIPLWMGIVNLTPDSFSDGGQWGHDNFGDLDAYLAQLIDHNIHIIDLGGESTRPGAATISPTDEWARLQPVLEKLAERLDGRHIKPWLSVDSRHPRVIEKALGYGVEIINDVTGLTDPDIIAVARQNDCQVIAMHNLGVPPDPSITLPHNCDAAAQLVDWAEAKMENWAAAGLDLNRVIFDPGIGYGKSPIHAFELLSQCRRLRQLGMRLLIGHSRKSFMHNLTAHPPPQRDFETLGLSLALCRQGVDIIRIHAPQIHMRAYLAWAHLREKLPPQIAPQITISRPKSPPKSP